MNTKTLAIVMPIGPALAECDESLPFAVFGRSGGYGLTRAALVKALRAKNWTEAQRWFDTLVAEGFQDIYNEAVFEAEIDGVHGPMYTDPDAVRRDFIEQAMNSDELFDYGKWLAWV